MRVNWFYVLILVGPLTGTVVRGEKSQEWMKGTLQKHFSHPRHHSSNPDYKQAAMEFILKEMKSMGLVTYKHTFDTVLDDVKGINVIGVLEGADYGLANDTVVAVGAHYDTVRNSPGVDDNGSGVVSLLQAAREITRHPHRNSTILFIAFDFGEYENETDAACLESSSLCGSRALVADWLPKFFQFWPSPWKAILSMDTILNFQDEENIQDMMPGYGLLFPNQKASLESDNNSGDFLSAVCRYPQDSRYLHLFNDTWFTLGEKQYEIEVFDMPTTLLRYAPDLSESHHFAFWEKNLSAVYLSDTAIYRGYMQTCYHEACDSLVHVTDVRLGFLAKITRAVVAWVDQLAAPLTDEPVDGTGAAVSTVFSSVMKILATTISFVLVCHVLLY